jgi:hypothetical protein
MAPVPDKPEERRRGWRYPVTLGVSVGKNSGLSRDVSASGVFFETDAPVSPGQPITFSFTLNDVYPNLRLALQCTGKIVRVEQRDGRLGVAATIESWSFESSARAGTEATPTSMIHTRSPPNTPRLRHRCSR